MEITSSDGLGVMKIRQFGYCAHSQLTMIRNNSNHKYLFGFALFVIYYAVIICFSFLKFFTIYLIFQLIIYMYCSLQFKSSMNIAVNLFKLYISAVGARIFALMKYAGCGFQIEQLVVYGLGGFVQPRSSKNTNERLKKD